MIKNHGDHHYWMDSPTFFYIYIFFLWIQYYYKNVINQESLPFYTPSWRKTIFFSKINIKKKFYINLGIIFSFFLYHSYFCFYFNQESQKILSMIFFFVFKKKYLSIDEKKNNFSWEQIPAWPSAPFLPFYWRKVNKMVKKRVEIVAGLASLIFFFSYFFYNIYHKN